MRPPNERRYPVVTPGAAETLLDAFAGKSNPDHSGDRRSEQAGFWLAYNRERLLWCAFQRALDFDLAEGTPETKIIRTLAHGAWREAFLADGAP